MGIFEEKTFFPQIGPKYQDEKCTYFINHLDSRCLIGMMSNLT